MVMRRSGSTVSMRRSRSRAPPLRCVGSVNAPALIARNRRPTLPSSNGSLRHTSDLGFGFSASAYHYAARLDRTEHAAHIATNKWQPAGLS